MKKKKNKVTIKKQRGKQGTVSIIDIPEPEPEKEILPVPQRIIKGKKDLTAKNHIEEYFANKEMNKDVLTSKELFKAERKDVDIRTDINWKEIVLVNKLMWNNFSMRKHKLVPAFDEFVNEYLRLKISNERKSRTEFVTMNRGDKTQEVIQGMSDFANIVQTKK